MELFGEVCFFYFYVCHVFLRFYFLLSACCSMLFASYCFTFCFLLVGFLPLAYSICNAPAAGMSRSSYAASLDRSDSFCPFGKSAGAPVGFWVAVSFSLSRTW